MHDVKKATAKHIMKYTTWSFDIFIILFLPKISEYLEILEGIEIYQKTTELKYQIIRGLYKTQNRPKNIRCSSGDDRLFGKEEAEEAAVGGVHLAEVEVDVDVGGGAGRVAEAARYRLFRDVVLRG